MLERIAARLTINAAVIALLSLALAVQTARIEGFKVWPLSVTGYKARVESLSEKLRHISDKRNEQAKVTTRTVEKARVIYRDAEKQAARIEAAPVAGKCETPAVILGADL